jgi:predicted HTH transcriptional regulator
VRSRDEIESDELGWEAVLEVLLDIRDLLAPVKHITPDGKRELGRKSTIVYHFIREHPDVTAKEIHRRLADGKSLESVYNSLRRLIAQGFVEQQDNGDGPATFRLVIPDGEAS